MSGGPKGIHVAGSQPVWSGVYRIAGQLYQVVGMNRPLVQGPSRVTLDKIGGRRTLDIGVEALGPRLDAREVGRLALSAVRTQSNRRAATLFYCARVAADMEERNPPGLAGLLAELLGDDDAVGGNS